MNDRIQYLKTLIRNDTADIEAYRVISEKEYDNATYNEEIFRKAQFLRCLAQKIPVVIDAQEQIVGSMRFWRIRECGRNIGHIIVDYRMILREGIPGIQNRIAKLTTWESHAFCEAMTAFSVLIDRYAKAAADLNMNTVAKNCRQLTVGAPKTFHQALQLIWFVHLFLHAEGMAPALSFGRFDDYLYPFYKNDIEAGILTRQQAKELLMCFWLKTCEGDESQNLTLGGNIENDLTFLCMEVTGELRVQQPSISVRTNDNTSAKLWDKITELVKCKIGMPAIFNDNTVIKALTNVGVEQHDAENYAIVGCYEANSDGNTFGSTANAGEFPLHDILLDFLDPEKTYGDFPEFYQAFQTFFKEKYATDLLPSFRRKWEHIRNDFVSPFQSACMDGCLQSGIPAEWGGCKYTMAGINILGIGTLIDSIYAMKKIVFEHQEYGYSDFVRQVKDNFPDKELAEKCRNLKGKYGTDTPETNAMAEDLSTLIADLVDNGKVYDEVISYGGLFMFLCDVNSERYPATPDGRFFGERVSYGVGASDICTDKTITSILNSATHIANDRFADGNPLMFSLPEKDVAGEKGDALLKALIKGYFQMGGFHLHINVTDAETLKKAQKCPQEYSDLIVRISGYSEYFTRLNETIQTALIERS